MDKRISHSLTIILFVGGWIMFMAVSCRPSDSQLTKAVTTAASAVTPNVFVKVQNGRVTLSGIVSNEEVKHTLDSTVRELKGVVSVVDKTSFGEPPPPPPPSATPYPMNYPDTLAAKSIDTAFKYNHISGVNISVINGIITLTGNTTKKDLKTVLRIANESNPKKIINKLTVK